MNGHQVSLPAITYQGSHEADQPDDTEVEAQSADQRLHQAMCSSTPTELDTLLQRIMDPNTQSEILEKPKNLTTSKRPRNKRKANQSKPPENPSYHPPVVDDNSTEFSKNSLTNN